MPWRWLGIISAALSLALATPVQALDGAYLMSMDGVCARLNIGGEDATSDCEQHLVHGVTANGRVIFSFADGDTALISFSGWGQTQAKLTADRVRQPIDRIRTRLLGPDPKDLDGAATGYCTYGNPYKGVTEVHCLARLTSTGSTIEGRFLTNGRAPSMMPF